jgi:hypothetical protein
MNGTHGAALAALLLFSMTGCSSSRQASAADSTTTTTTSADSSAPATPAADGTIATAAPDAANPAPTSAPASTGDADGTGHASLTGQMPLEQDFAVSGCAVGPPGDGLLSGYRMTAKDDTKLGLLAIALKDYTKDGAYEQPVISAEAAVAKTMTSGVMGPLTLMVMHEGAAPYMFGQVAGSKLTITVSNDGAKGSAEFTDLQSQPDMAELDPSSGKMPKGKRVSGSITWTCSKVDHINPQMNNAVNGMFKKLIPPR